MSFFDSEKSDDIASAESFFAEVRNEKPTIKKTSVSDIASAESFYDELRNVQAAGPAVPGRPEKPPELAAEIEAQKNPKRVPPDDVPEATRRRTDDGQGSDGSPRTDDKVSGVSPSTDDGQGSDGSPRTDDDASEGERSSEEPDDELLDGSTSTSSETPIYHGEDDMSVDTSDEESEVVQYFDSDETVDVTMDDFKSFKMVVFARPLLIESPDISALPIVIDKKLELIERFQKRCNYTVVQGAWKGADGEEYKEDSPIVFDYHRMLFALPESFRFLLDKETFASELKKVSFANELKKVTAPQKLVKDGKEVKDPAKKRTDPMDDLQLYCQYSMVANVQALFPVPMSSKAAALRLLSNIHGAMYLDRFRFFKGKFFESGDDTTRTAEPLLAPAEILRQVLIMSDVLQRNFAFGMDGSVERETVRYEIEQAPSRCLQAGIDTACFFQQCYELAATWHEDIWKWFSKIAEMREVELGATYAIQGILPGDVGATLIEHVNQYDIMLKLRALTAYIDMHDECMTAEEKSNVLNVTGLKQVPIWKEETVYKNERFVFKNDLYSSHPVFASRHVKLQVSKGAQKVTHGAPEYVQFSTSPSLLEQNYGVPPPGLFYLKFSITQQDNIAFFDGKRINYNPWLECLCRLSILNELLYLNKEHKTKDTLETVAEWDDTRCIAARMAYCMFVDDPCFQSLWRDMNQDPDLLPQLQNLGVDMKDNNVSESIEFLFAAKNLNKYSFDVICKIFLDYRHIKHILEDGKTLSCKWFHDDKNLFKGRPQSFGTMGKNTSLLGVERIGLIKGDRWHAYFPHVGIDKITEGGVDNARQNAFWQRLRTEYFGMHNYTPDDMNTRGGLSIPFGIEDRKKLTFTITLRTGETYTDLLLSSDLNKLFADMHRDGKSLPKTLKVMSSAFNVTLLDKDGDTTRLSVSVMVPTGVEGAVQDRYNASYRPNGAFDTGLSMDDIAKYGNDTINAVIVDMSEITSEDDTERHVYTKFDRVFRLTMGLLQAIPEEAFERNEPSKCLGGIDPKQLKTRLKSQDEVDDFFYNDHSPPAEEEAVGTDDGLPDLEFFWASLIAMGHQSTVKNRDVVQSTTNTSMNIAWPVLKSDNVYIPVLNPPNDTISALKAWNRFFSPKLMDAPLKSSIEYFCAAFKLNRARELHRVQLEDVLSKFSRSNMLSDFYSLAYQRRATSANDVASKLLQGKKNTQFTDLSHVSLFPEMRRNSDPVPVPRLIFKCDYFDGKTSSNDDDAKVAKAYKKLCKLRKTPPDDFQTERETLVKILQKHHNQRQFGPRSAKAVTMDDAHDQSVRILTKTEKKRLKGEYQENHEKCLEQAFTRLRTIVGYMAQIDFGHMARRTRGESVDESVGQAMVKDMIGIDAFQQRMPRLMRLVCAYKNLAAIIAEDVGCTWSAKEGVLTLEQRINDFEKGMCRFQVRGEVHPMFRNVEKPNMLEGMTMEQFQLLDAASQTGIKAYFWCKIFELRTNSEKAIEWKEEGGAVEVELTFKAAPAVTVRRTRIIQSGLDLYRYEFLPRKDDTTRLDRQSYFFPRQFADEFSTIDIVEPCANFCPMAMKSFDKGKGAVFEGKDDEPPFDKLVEDRDKLGYVQEPLAEDNATRYKRDTNQHQEPRKIEYDKSFQFTHRVLHLDWEKMKKHNDPKMYSLFKKVEVVLSSVDFLCDGVIKQKQAAYNGNSKKTFLPPELVFCFDGRDFLDQYLLVRDELDSHFFDDMQYNMDSIMRVPCWNKDYKPLFFKNTIDDTKRPSIRKLGMRDYDEDAVGASVGKAADGGFFLCRSIAEDVSR